MAISAALKPVVFRLAIPKVLMRLMKEGFFACSGGQQCSECDVEGTHFFLQHRVKGRDDAALVPPLGGLDALRNDR